MHNHHILPTTNFTHEDVALRAYLLWEKAGKPPGRDAELWLQAEIELRAPHKAAALPAMVTNGNPRSATAAPKRATRPAARAPRNK